MHVPDHQADRFRVRADLDFAMNEVALRISAHGDGRWLTITAIHEGRFAADLESQPDPLAESDALVTMPRRLAEAIRDELVRELGVGRAAWAGSSWSAGWGTVLPEPPPHPDSVRLDRLLQAVADSLRLRGDA